MSMALHHRERSFAIFVSEAALASRSSTDQLPGSRRTSVPRMAPSIAKHPLFHTSEMAMPLERGTAFRRSQSLGSPDKANLERLMIHGTRQGPCTLAALLAALRTAFLALARISRSGALNTFMARPGRRNR